VVLVTGFEHLIRVDVFIVFGVLVYINYLEAGTFLSVMCSRDSGKIDRHHLSVPRPDKFRSKTLSFR